MQKRRVICQLGCLLETGQISSRPQDLRQEFQKFQFKRDLIPLKPEKESLAVTTGVEGLKIDLVISKYGCHRILMPKWLAIFMNIDWSCLIILEGHLKKQNRCIT